jgi:death-on-curing protein
VGMRSLGGVESAVARGDQILSYAENAGLPEVAVAICVGILRNPPFVDGNKRTAFAALGITLERNGHYLDATEDDATRMILRAGGSEIGEAELREWVEQHMKREA